MGLVVSFVLAVTMQVGLGAMVSSGTLLAMLFTDCIYRDMTGDRQ